MLNQSNYFNSLSGTVSLKRENNVNMLRKWGGEQKAYFSTSNIMFTDEPSPAEASLIK